MDWTTMLEKFAINSDHPIFALIIKCTLIFWFLYLIQGQRQNEKKNYSNLKLLRCVLFNNGEKVFPEIRCHLYFEIFYMSLIPLLFNVHNKFHFLKFQDLNLSHFRSVLFLKLATRKFESGRRRKLTWLTIWV